MPGPPPLQQMGVLPGTGAPMPSLSLAPSAIAQAPPQPPPPPQIQVNRCIMILLLDLIQFIHGKMICCWNRLFQQQQKIKKKLKAAKTAERT